MATLLAVRTAWRRRPALFAGAGVLLIYLVIGVVTWWHIWAHPATWQVGGGLGDPAASDWFLRWVPYALDHHRNPFVAHIANVPFGLNVIDNTSTLALGLVMLPVTLLVGPIASYNVLITVASPLAAGAAYLLARRFTTWRPAAFAAGLLYGFGPYAIAQTAGGHLNLAFTALPPIILLLVHELLVRQRWRAVPTGVGLAVVAVTQFFISTEILATTAIFSLVGVVLLAVAGRRQVRERSGHAVGGLVVAGVLGLVAVSPALYEAFNGTGHLINPDFGYRLYHGSLLAPITPGPLTVIGPGHLKHEVAQKIGGNQSENGTYLGIPLVLVLLLAPFLIRKRATWVAAALAAVAFVLSLGQELYLFDGRPGHGTGIPLPGTWFVNLAIIKQSLPVRFAMFVDLFGGVVLAIVIDTVRQRLDARQGVEARSGIRRPGPVLAAVVGAVALVPLVPALPVAGQVKTTVPSYFTSSAVKQLPPGAVVLVYPLATASFALSNLWQAEAGLRFQMVGGYFLQPAANNGSQFSSHSPVEIALDAVQFDGPGPARTPALRTELRTLLKDWRVTDIVAGALGQDPFGFFTWLTGRPADGTSGGVEYWYHLTWS